jgi:hypothetical protein
MRRELFAGKKLLPKGKVTHYPPRPCAPFTAIYAATHLRIVRVTVGAGEAGIKRHPEDTAAEGLPQVL